MSAAMKRNSMCGAFSPAKKPKKNALAVKCGVIEAAIRRAEAVPATTLTSAAAATLVTAVPFSLGLAKEERHKFQEEAVEIIGQVLDDYKAVLEGRVETSQSAVTNAENRRDELQAAAQQRQADFDDANSSTAQLKLRLAEDARGFQAAKAAVEEAERLAEEGSRELKSAAARKKEVEKMQEDMEHIHENQDGRSLKDFVKRVENLLEVDSSMMTAIPCVLSKQPDTRGQFDLMVVKQLIEKMHNATAKFNDTIEGGAAAEAERTEALEAAKVALQQARQKQIAAARAFTDASSAMKQAEDAVHMIKNESLHAKKALKEVAQTKTDAEVDLDLFCQEVLHTFSELRDRSTTSETTLIDASASPAQNASPNATGESPTLVVVPTVIAVA